MSLAVWWWTSEAVPHPFQLQGGVVSISKCQKLSPGGISELRWWALAVSLGTNAHLTKPTAISDMRWVTAEGCGARLQCPVSCWVLLFLTNDPLWAFCTARCTNTVAEHREWIRFFLLRCGISRSGRSCAGMQKLVLVLLEKVRENQCCPTEQWIAYSVCESRQSIGNYTKYSCLKSLFT